MPKKIPNPDALKVAIVDGVADGTPLAQMCRELGVGLRTFYDWAEADPELAARIARARDVGEDVIAADILKIIDQEPSLSVTQFGSSYDSASVTWSKNRAEMRLKLLAKWNPKKWGDKVQLGGAADLPPIQSNVTIEPADAYKALIDGPSGGST
jgi:hypothetical protein